MFVGVIISANVYVESTSSPKRVGPVAGHGSPVKATTVPVLETLPNFW